MSLFRNKGQEGKTDLVWGLVPVGGGGYKERVKQGEYGRNIILMYENGE
jgi:hypothetical protein